MSETLPLEEADPIHNRAHTMAAGQVAHELHTNLERGLTMQDYEAKYAEYGPNKIPEQIKISWMEMLWAQINSMIIYILVIGAAISFAFHHILDGIVIIGVVIINVGLGFYMEIRAVNATDSLTSMMSPTATVVRDGEKITTETISLVPGDLILIQPGDIAPADARIVKQSNLQMMEAALTGESHATMKDATPQHNGAIGLADRKCMIFSGTQVIKGTATCIVTATGQNCEIGKISGLLADIKPAKTPLLRQLEKFGLILSIIIIAFAFGTFGIAVARGYSIGDSLSIAIGVAVAAIPEGLPSCITVTFAIGVRFMAEHHAIVKSLPAVETLGSVSVICSDKTGTLTMNKMSVQRVILNRVSEPVVDTSALLSGATKSDVLNALLPGVLCNDSTLQLEADRDLASAPSDVASAGDIELAGAEPTADKPSAAENDKLALEAGGRGWAVEGDPTERCIVELAALSDAPQAIKQLMTRNPRLAEIPFDSATKYMATMHSLSPELLEGLRATGYSAELPTGEVGRVVYVKGAPEKVLSFCFDEADVRPEIVSARASWLKHAESLAGQGMRVLGLAYRVFPADHELGETLPPATLHLPEDVFVMSAMVGIIDPPRAEAIVAVKAAQDAGIIVKMITGDHPVTAYAIGRQLGLQVDRGRGITGTELDEITIRSMAELDDCVVQNDVFARTTPEHKLRIVESLRRQGYVCSMTGDGVNDAPALKAANIGVAMGITGTEVAKEAAHMIITDDNFATIVEAIRMGRCTYANLIKIIAFVLPTNGGQAFSIIGALIIDVQVPITALQILWVNMITSVTLGVVLAFDKPDRHILEDAPRGPHKPIFGKFLTWRVFTVTIFLILLVLGIFHWEKHRRNDLEYLRTCSVNALVTAQIGYIFSCRDLRRNTDLRGLLCGNRVFYLGIFAITACQVLFTYSPGFQYVFKTKPLDGESWGKIILLAVVVFLAVELDKFLNLQRKRLLGWCCGAPTSRALQSPLYSPVVGGGRVRTHRTGRGGRDEASMVVRSTFDGTEEGDGFVRRRSLDDGRRSMNTSIYNMAS